MFISFFWGITILLSAFYLLLYRFFLNGWKATEEIKSDNIASSGQTAFSILIPARNEEATLESTLNDLAAQNYDPSLFEIIILDDHSTDGTTLIAETFIARHTDLNIRLTRMQEHPAPAHTAYKKAALTLGVQLSRHPWIITTDADCRREADWLAALAAYIESRDPKMISGPVRMIHGSDFFSRWQALEFGGLIGIGAASMTMGRPNMCNGANLAFRKDAFLEAGGYEGLTHLASGDDELLMHRFHARWPGQVMFLKDYRAAVSTRTEKTPADLIRQRKRWVSKSRKYSDKRITAIMSGAYLFNLALAAALVLSFFSSDFVFPFFILLLVKLGAEAVFLNRTSAFLQQRDCMRIFLPSSLLHMVYVLFIGIYGNFGGYNWKGRRTT